MQNRPAGKGTGKARWDDPATHADTTVIHWIVSWITMPILCNWLLHALGLAAERAQHHRVDLLQMLINRNQQANP